MKESRHPSFGLIEWSRTRGQRSNMFMSSLQHSTWITIRIRGARRIRSSTHDTRASGAGEQNHIEVSMTEAQFAAFISNPNQMDGVPCTISSIGGKRVEQCPDDDQLLQFQDELHSSANEVVREAKEALDQLNSISIDGVIKKKELREQLHNVRSKLEATILGISSNMPFLVTQFNEHMEQIFGEAVAHYEGYVKVRKEELIEKLKDTFRPTLINDKGEES